MNVYGHGVCWRCVYNINYYYLLIYHVFLSASYNCLFFLLYRTDIEARNLDMIQDTFTKVCMRACTIKIYNHI